MKKWAWIGVIVLIVLVMDTWSKGATSPASAGPAPNVGTAGYPACSGALGSDANQFNPVNSSSAPGAQTVGTDPFGFGVSGSW